MRLAPIVLLYLFLSLLTVNQFEEDAFIYFRIVDNVVDGHGIVFNAGGERVEAASSLTWLLLLVGLRQLPLSLIVSSKLLGIAFGCASLWIVYRLSTLVIGDRWLRLAPALLTAVSTPFVLCNQRGLETPLFDFLVLALVWCCVDPGKFRWWPLPAALLLPSRPEGWFFVAGVLPTLFLHRREPRLLARQVGLVAAVALALLTFRFLYFHDFVPQAFYAKIGSGLGAGWTRLWAYLTAGPVPALYVAPLAAVFWRPRFWTPARIALLAFLLLTTLWCVIAKDPMPFLRHLVPAVPLGCLLIVSALDSLAQRTPPWRSLASAYVGGLAVAALLLSSHPEAFGTGTLNPMRAALAGLASRPWGTLRDSFAKAVAPLEANALDAAPIGQPDDVPRTNFQRLVGEFLAANAAPSAVVVYDQMGQTPYYAGSSMTFIDSFGLTDRTIARCYFGKRMRNDGMLSLYDRIVSHAVAAAFGERRLPLDEQSAVEYLLAQQPDFVLVNTLAVGPRSPVGLLTRSPRFTALYHQPYTINGLIPVFQRNDVPDRRPLIVPPGLNVVPN